MLLFPVILCGGSGTRLWPLSRSRYPKQFMDIAGHTLFGDTVQRAMGLPGVQRSLVVCNEAQRYLAAAHAPANAVEAIILEPESRNTAPAIALAAHKALRLAEELGSDDEPVLLVLPSDHSITGQGTFAENIVNALPVAQAGFLVTFGITPTAPATGYGYIEQGEALPGYDNVFSVARFLEKPQQAQAQAMLDKGGHSWNSGMFMFTAAAYLEELSAHAPDMAMACAEACRCFSENGDFTRVDNSTFLKISPNSVDYAVLEHTNHAALVPVSLKWSDLGTWESFYESGLKDQASNVCIGDVMAEDCTGCYLHGTDRLVASLGLQNMVVIETADAVLVAPRARSQDVKSIVHSLALAQRPEKDTHVRVYRPWGNYEVLHCQPRFQVKRITVNPGAVLSRQLHYHRAEHWVVVSGTAVVTVGDQSKLLKENQSVYIELGVEHRLENPGRIPLMVIEVQTGSYLGEDDIVRLEDFYGRV